MEKSNECKSSVMPYIAIVAIVAVVAVVILVMNGGSSSVSEAGSDESALAGQAINPVPPIQHIYLPYQQLANSLASSPDWDSTMSGARVCSKLGYSGCVTAFVQGNASYYVSNNGACTGLQLNMFNYSSRDCATPAVSGYNSFPPRCITIPGNVGNRYNEPYVGDVMHSSRLKDVICIR